MKLLHLSLLALCVILSYGCKGIPTGTPESELSLFLDEMKHSELIEVWTPEDRETLFPVTNKVAITKLSDWIGAQIMEYDPEDSDARKNGMVCGCLPMIAVKFSDNQTVSVHGHNLIINNALSFAPSEPYQFDSYSLGVILLQMGLMKKDVLLYLSMDEALVLMRGFLKFIG